MKSTCHETILLPLTSHHSVKFINTLKAEQPLFIWQTALQNMTAPHFPTLRSHPNLQLVSTCKKEKKKSANSICWWAPRHTSTFHSQRRAGLLDKIIKIVFYQGKFFLGNRKVQRDLLSHTHFKLVWNNAPWGGNTDSHSSTLMKGTEQFPLPLKILINKTVNSGLKKLLEQKVSH